MKAAYPSLGSPWCLFVMSRGSLSMRTSKRRANPASRVAAAEALQCPTLLLNGFGGHRIEGIGDKHVPWIHNLRNTDMVIAVDDEHTMRLLRLFNEEAGRDYLRERGVDGNTVDNLDLFGISSIGNMLGAIKFAKYFDLTERDVVLTVFTDSLELYGSRLSELRAEHGPYTNGDAVRDFEMLRRVSTDAMMELTYPDRKRVHNLKYYTWIEQQGKPLDELNAQWYDHVRYWDGVHGLTGRIDELIDEFNDMVGLL